MPLRHRHRGVEGVDAENRRRLVAAAHQRLPVEPGRCAWNRRTLTGSSKLDSTPLVEQGVIFTADAPQFIYTSVGEAKIEMLAEAAKDARARAEQIATQGGRGIAQLHDADQGIFQITPQHSTDTSGEGMNDTTARWKTITAVVTATFLLK
jgi:hypothetical protein